MDEKFNMTVRFSAEARAATDSFSKAYEVHLQMVKRSLRPIIYNALQQHYLAAEAYAEQNSQPRMLILAFQRGLRHILEWKEGEKRRFIQSVGVEQGVSRAMRLPGDILHAINNLLHVLMFTDSEITELVESGLTHCPGFAIHSVSTVGDVVVQCLQEAAYHFDGSPFLFSRAIKSETWIENRQKIFNQIDNIIGVVLSEMATNMVGSVCKRLLETRYKQPTVALTLEKDSEEEDETSGGKKQTDVKTRDTPTVIRGGGGAPTKVLEAAKASVNPAATPKEAKKEKEPTRYTDTRLLYGHADDQEYLEHAYNRGTYRDTSTPLRVTQGSVSAERVEPRQYSAGTTMAESSSAATSQPHSKRVEIVTAPLAQQQDQQTQVREKEQEQMQVGVQEQVREPPAPVLAAAPSKPYHRQIAPPTNMPFQQKQQPPQQTTLQQAVALPQQTLAAEVKQEDARPPPSQNDAQPAITLTAQAQVVSGETAGLASPLRPVSAVTTATKPLQNTLPTATPVTTQNNNALLKSTGSKTLALKNPSSRLSLVTLDGESPKDAVVPEDDAASLKNELGQGIVDKGVMSLQLLQDQDAVQSSQ